MAAAVTKAAALAADMALVVAVAVAVAAIRDAEDVDTADKSVGDKVLATKAINTPTIREVRVVSTTARRTHLLCNPTCRALKLLGTSTTYLCRSP